MSVMKEELIRGTGGQIDGMVMALIDHSYDKNEKVVSAVLRSLQDLGLKQPNLVLSSCHSYLLRHKKKVIVSLYSIIILFIIVMGMLALRLKFSASSFLRLVNFRTVFRKNVSYYEAPVVDRAKQFLDKNAMFDNEGIHTYKKILNLSRQVASKIINQTDGNGIRVGYLCLNNHRYIVSQNACWLSGNIAVPLCQMHLESQLEHCITDSQCSILLASSSFIDVLKPISVKHDIPLWNVDEFIEENQFEHSKDANYMLPHYKDGALIIYTSGTTGLPKGVLLSHENILAMIRALVSAWQLRKSDMFLHSLPLHHLHGIINGLLCPLYMGSTILMLPKFDASEVWKCFLDDNLESKDITVFMGVPTMYAKLIQEYETNLKNIYPENQVKEILTNKFRLMISGSASMPIPIMERWKVLSGIDLLERYGMSEIGMALSNPLNGKKIPGCVGLPLPEISVRIISKEASDEEGKLIVEGDENFTTIHDESGLSSGGELLVHGPSVFLGYWNNLEGTKESFTEDGWFKTGDVVTYLKELDSYKILGRSSVDIIKSGGYKISSLQIEHSLLSNENILDCAVIGQPDELYGEIIVAVVQLKENIEISENDLAIWCTGKLPKYQMPKRFLLVPSVPRNNMGKINKKELKKIFFK